MILVLLNYQEAKAIYTTYGAWVCESSWLRSEPPRSEVQCVSVWLRSESHTRGASPKP